MENRKLQSILGAPGKIVEQKRFSSRKRNWLLIIFGVLVLIMMVWGLSPNISKRLFSPDPPYKKELRKAEWCASELGFSQMMEDHLIKAKWDAREKGVDISEKVKEIYAMGSLSVLESALSKALYGHTGPAKYTLIRYKRFCSEAEIPPDDKKIAEVEMIIRRN